jgi:hypothetical protein
MRCVFQPVATADHRQVRENNRLGGQPGRSPPNLRGVRARSSPQIACEIVVTSMLPPIGLQAWI